MRPAKFPGTCSCGAAVAVGDMVALRQENSRWKVVGCGACRQQRPAAPVVSLRVSVQAVKVSGRSDGFSVVRASLVDAPPPDYPATTTLDVKGTTLPSDLRVGDVLDVRGRLEERQPYGWSIAAELVARAVVETDRGMVAYLSRFNGIGEARAEAILRHFGGREAVKEVLLGAPERLAEVKGITEAMAQEAGKKFRAQASQNASLFFLDELGVRPALQAKILKWCEDQELEVRDVVTADPYCLMELPGVGLLTCDELATKLKVEKNDPRRLRAVAYHLLAYAENDGHTWSSLEDLMGI